MNGSESVRYPPSLHMYEYSFEKSQSITRACLVQVEKLEGFKNYLI